MSWAAGPYAAPQKPGLPPEQIHAILAGTRLLPEPGTNLALLLDELCERKHITHEGLARQDIRVTRDTTLVRPDPWDRDRVVWCHHVLVIPYGEGVRYRDLQTNNRWGAKRSNYSRTAKVVRRDPTALERAAVLVVVEGETDAARMLDADVLADVMILGGSTSYAAQPGPVAAMRKYPRVLLALDADAAGDKAAVMAQSCVPWAERWCPEAVDDWCATLEPPPPLPEPDRGWILQRWADWLVDLGHDDATIRDYLDQVEEALP